MEIAENYDQDRVERALSAITFSTQLPHATHATRRRIIPHHCSLCVCICACAYFTHAVSKNVRVHMCLWVGGGEKVEVGGCLFVQAVPVALCSIYLFCSTEWHNGCHCNFARNAHHIKVEGKGGFCGKLLNAFSCAMH